MHNAIAIIEHVLSLSPSRCRVQNTQEAKFIVCQSREWRRLKVTRHKGAWRGRGGPKKKKRLNVCRQGRKSEMNKGQHRQKGDRERERRRGEWREGGRGKGNYVVHVKCGRAWKQHVANARQIVKNSQQNGQRMNCATCPGAGSAWVGEVGVRVTVECVCVCV